MIYFQIKFKYICIQRWAQQPVFAWNPWMEELGLKSIGSHRIRHDFMTARMHVYIHICLYMCVFL